MGNSNSVEGDEGAQQGQQVPPYTANTGVAGINVDNSKKQQGGGAPPASNNGNYSAMIDEEIPVAVAVPMPPPSDVEASAAQQPAMNPSYQRQLDPQSQQQQVVLTRSANSTGAPKPGATAATVAALPVHTATTQAATANYPPQQQQPQQQMILYLKRKPTLLVQCPMCRAPNIRTRTSTFPNWMTWISAIALFFIFWPICWISTLR